MGNTLITGHKGLLGSSLAQKIQSHAYPGRIDSMSIFLDYLKSNNIDTVIHTAAKVGGVKANFENKFDFYIENSNLNNIVFEACLKAKIKTFINFSSTCVFPDNAIYPLTENQIFNGKPHYTNDAYAYSKRMMQFLCTLARQQGFNYFTLIPTNLYGFNDNYNLDNSHVLPALIHKCYLAKKYSIDYVVWGDGSSLREFVFVEDLPKITQELMKLDLLPYDSVIISNSKEISIQYCVDLIARYMNFQGKIVFDKTKPNGQSRKPTNNIRLKTLLPNFEFTPFEEGLQNTIDWFINHYDSARK